MTLFQKKNETNSSQQAGGSKQRSLLSRLFTQTALMANLVVIAVFVLADSARVVSPERLILPSMLGLAFPLIAIANFAFLFWWVIRRRWYLVFSLTSILFCYDSVKETFPVNFADEETEAKKSIKVLSYNVRLFDFYKKASKNKVLDYLLKSEADVICIQEYGFSKKAEFLKENEIIEILGRRYPYHHSDFGQNSTTRTFGVATFSKFPILSKRKIEYNSLHNSSILTEISIDGKAYNIINCHLESNKITENDRLLISQLKDKLGSEVAKNTAEQLTKKLTPSYLLRAEQAEKVASVVEKCGDPIILCGDFNDVPVSYAYNTIKGKKLESAFAENGLGYGVTFRERMFPFRIDHILYSKELKSYDFRIDTVSHSDHFPIMCQIELEK